MTHVTIDKTLLETTQLRPVKYLNNIVEQDPAVGTLRGYEAMNMIRKGQVQGVEKGDILGQVERLRVVGGFSKSSRVTPSVSQIFGVVV